MVKWVISLSVPSILISIGFVVGSWSSTRSEEHSRAAYTSAEAETESSSALRATASSAPHRTSRGSSQEQSALSTIAVTPSAQDEYVTHSSGAKSPESSNTALSPPHQRSALELQACQDQVETFSQHRERQAVQAAELIEVKQTRDELLKLLQFSETLVNYQVSLGVVTSAPNLPLHQPFSVCTYQPDQSAVSVGDLVAAQGALLGEVIELTDHRCVKVLPTVSSKASFEVRLAQSGVHGVAIGLGEGSGEEAVGASVKLKYLERSRPALIGEQVYLVARHQKSKGEFASVQRLPSLVVGEVLNAEMKENGLFQEASVTLPLRRAGIEWVAIISTPSP